MFTTARGAIPNTSNLRHTVLRAADRAGFEPFALHELRHSAATLAAWTAATTAELQARLGHSTNAAAAAYQHAAAERNRELADRLGRLAGQAEVTSGSAD